MWIKYRSLFLIVRIRADRVRLVIPLPLFVLDQSLSALEDLAWLADRIVPGSTDRWIHRSIPPTKRGTFRPVIKLLRELITEMRRYGRWRMVEIETGNEGPSGEKVHVYLDFY